MIEYYGIPLSIKSDGASIVGVLLLDSLNFKSTNMDLRITDKPTASNRLLFTTMYSRKEVSFEMTPHLSLFKSQVEFLSLIVPYF